MKPKKIAIFTSSFNSGGVERALVTLANTMASEGHSVEFVVSLNQGILQQELLSKVNIIDFGGVRLRGSFLMMYKYLKKTNLDAVISGPTYPNIILIICNLLNFKKHKIIISQHSYQDIEVKNLGVAGKIMPFLMKSTYNLSTKVVAVSDGVKEDLIQNYNVKSSKIKVIYNAVIDDSFFYKANIPVETSLLEKLSEKPFFAAVGRLEPVKNYGFMIKMFAKFKIKNPDIDYNLVIIGGGTELERLTEKINNLGLQKSIILVGGTSNPYNILKLAKILIHTSYSEAMPLVYVEALALRIPVVTVTNKGALEILEHIKPKMIVEKHDIDDFIFHLEKMQQTHFDDHDFPSLAQFEAKVIVNKFLELI